jgi:hypothetical protein
MGLRRSLNHLRETEEGCCASQVCTGVVCLDQISESCLHIEFEVVFSSLDLHIATSANNAMAMQKINP